MHTVTRGPGASYAVIGSEEGAAIPDEITAGLLRLGFAVLERPLTEPLSSVMNGVNARLILLSLRGAPKDSLDAIARYAGSSSGLVVILLPPDAPPQLMAGCLGSGADLCFAWDEDPQFVLASIEAATRKESGSATDSGAETGPTTMQTGDLLIDFARRQVFKQGSPVPLSPTEVRFVAYLATKPDVVCSIQEIAQHIFPDELAHATCRDAIKTYVRRVRRKLEDNPDNPSYFLNVRGFGYLLRMRAHSEGH